MANFHSFCLFVRLSICLIVCLALSLFVNNFAPMDSLSLFSRLQLAKWVIKEGAFNPRQALKNEIAIPGMTAKAAGKVIFLLLKKKFSKEILTSI